MIAAKTSPSSSARERILTTAHDLFYRDGIRATGIDRVIAEAGVTKVTFYRHFPSKNDLVLEYLAFRHEGWMSWFREALARHKSKEPAQAIVLALKEWLGNRNYRGCAFINTVVELDAALPEATDLAKAHKQDMVKAIAEILPASPDRKHKAEKIAMAVDGAIIRAQMEKSAKAPLALLLEIIQKM